MFLTYVYKLYPSKCQKHLLQKTLDTCRYWYNHCLEERKTAYETNKVSITKREQLKAITPFKKTIGPIHTHVLQVATADLDKAFQNFFRRVKNGEIPGYPRFKGKDRFRSFGLQEYGNGFRVDGNRLRIYGIGRIPVRFHRPLPAQPKIVRIIKKVNEWFATFAVNVSVEPEPYNNESIGIDVGLSSLMTFSDGTAIENPKWYQFAQKKLRRLQRSVARKKKGGSNRRKSVCDLQRFHQTIENRRKDFLHKLSRTIVQRFGSIVIEDLEVQKLVEKGKHRLSKSILDASWSTFRQLLSYKAESAGRQLVFVEPAYTSQDCCKCGKRHELQLSDRRMKCDCGNNLNRDWNAAINIKNRAGQVLCSINRSVDLLPQEAAGV